MKSPKGGNRQCTVSHLESARMRFAEEMNGATITTVDPSDCFPLIIDRERYQGGVEKMKRIFSGLTSDGIRMDGQNIAASTGASVVVPITATYKPYLVKALLAKGLDEAQIRTEMDREKVWYGIVDGNFSFWAIMELMEEDPAVWGSLQWSSLVLRTTPGMDRLRQLKRTYETNRKAENCIDVTLYDEYQRMHDEFIRLKKGNKKDPSSTKVAEAYDGGKHVSTDSVAQKARTAIRLGPAVIKEMGHIMQREHPKLAIADLPSTHLARKGPTRAARYVDCRVFKRFITDRSIKHAAHFINRQGEDGEEVQLNVLHRLRNLFRKNGYKKNNYKVIMEKYDNCKRAMRQCRLFEKFIGSTTWPNELTVIRTKLLRGTDYDNDLMTIDENGDDIFPTLMNEYKTFFPDEYTRKKFMREQTNLDGHVGGICPEGNGDDETQLSISNTTDDQEDVQAHLTQQDKTEKTGATTVVVEKCQEEATKEVDKAAADAHARTACLNKMAKVGIEVHNMTWESYFTNVRGDYDPLFDLFLEDPPYGTPTNPSGAGSSYNDHLTDNNFTQHSDRIFKMLRTGGYVFLFTSVDYCESWKKAMRASGFVVWGGLFLLLKSLRGRQMRRKGMFPQIFNEFAIISRKPGKRSDNFSPDISSPYEFVKCRFPRRLGVIDEVPLPRPKLYDPMEKKKSIRVEEKSIEMPIEIMRTFCPSGGAIFDGFAGTLTTAIAALRTGRRCVAVEKDEVCFILAETRLRSVFLEIYKDQADVGVSEMNILPETDLLNIAREATNCELTNVDNCNDGDGVKTGIDNVDMNEWQDCDTESVFRSLEDIVCNVDNGFMAEFPQSRGCRSERSDKIGRITTDSRNESDRTGSTIQQSSTPSTSTETTGRNETQVELSKERPLKRKRSTESVQSLVNYYRSTGKISVVITHNDKPVGHANLATALDGQGNIMKGCLRRHLHGHGLDKLDAKYANAVVLRRCLIQTCNGDVPFHGLHLGGDDPPSILKDIRSQGFYLWPAADIVIE